MRLPRRSPCASRTASSSADARSRIGAVAADHQLCALMPARSPVTAGISAGSTGSGLRLKNVGLLIRCAISSTSPRMIMTAVMTTGEPTPRNGFA